MPDLFFTRALQVSDLDPLAAIADATLFPGDMLRGMAAAFLGGDADCLWQVVLHGAAPVGFAFAEAERMTDRTWNLRAIAVDPGLHGAGAGTALLAAVERALDGRARLIVIDTTQSEDQARARRFYAARGYAHAATIPAFFAAEEDKVTFIKSFD